MVFCYSSGSVCCSDNGKTGFSANHGQEVGNVSEVRWLATQDGLLGSGIKIMQLPSQGDSSVSFYYFLLWVGGLSGNPSHLYDSMYSCQPLGRGWRALGISTDVQNYRYWFPGKNGCFGR